MDSDNSFYGILPLHYYIKSLQETERWLAKVEAEIRGDEFPRKKKDYTPQYDDGYWNTLDVSNKTYYQILKGSIFVKKSTYIKVKQNATLSLRLLCEKYSDLDSDSDYPIEYDIMKQYLVFLKGHDIDTKEYEELLDDTWYVDVIDKLDANVSYSIKELFETYKLTENTRSEQPPKEYPIRILIEYDDRSVAERINSIISNIQRDHANPIILTSEFSDDDVDKYDLYYIIANTITVNVEKTITVLSKGRNLHCIKVFSKNDSFLQNTGIKKTNTNIRLINDQSSYMYELYADLMELIEERDEVISEFLSGRKEKLDKILKSSNPSDEVDMVDFNILKDPINLYDKKSVFYRLFIDEYITEQRRIAEIIQDRTDDIYRELVGMAAMYDIQMDVYLDYVKYLKEKKQYDKAIDYATQYMRFKEYKSESEEIDYEFYFLLGDCYNSMKNLDMAEHYLSKAQEMTPDDKFETTAMIIGIRASALWDSGRFVEAEKYVDVNLPFMEDSYKNNPELFRDALVKIYKTKANLLHAKKKLEEARIYFIRAIKISLGDTNVSDIEAFEIDREDISKANAKERYEISSICNNLGILNRRRGNYDESIKYYDFCIRIRKETYEKNTAVEAYMIPYAMVLTNKATMLWQIAGERASQIEITRLFDESIRLKKTAGVDFKNSNNFKRTMFHSYIEYMKYCINQKFYSGAEEYYKEAEFCISSLTDQNSDNSYKRFKAALDMEKAKLEIVSLGEKTVPSKECGELLKSAFETYEELYNANKGFYAEEVTDAGTWLLRYYEMINYTNKRVINAVLGTSLTAASNLAECHTVYTDKYEVLDEMRKKL